MKINFICPPASGNGGTETVLTKVLNHYAGQYNLTLTLTNKPENPLWLKQIDQRIKVVIASCDHGIKKQLFFIKTFLQTSNDTNLIMIGANMIKLAALVRKVFRKKYRIISWIHYSLFEQNLFDSHNILYADYHLAIASTIKKQLIQLGADENRIKLIFNPIEHNSIRKTDNLTDEISFIGRIQLQKQKNLSELFNGLSHVPETKLNILGTGEDVEAAKQLAQHLKISQRVKWYGWQKDPWEQISQHTQAIVLTSNFEGLPMVFLEAISRGIPVISSKFAGYDDVVIEGINGLSYEKGNIDQLAQKITQINQIAGNPQKIASSIEQFYTENYFKRLDSVFKEILQ